MKQDKSSQSLEHLGILAGVVKKIKLVERIDSCIPVSKEKGSKVTMGERVLSMIFNGLGFIDSRLYMFSDFLKTKPVNRIIGPHLTPEDFTDDSLGRCLDAIHDFGTTKFISTILFLISSQMKLLGRTLHIDSTSLTLYGDYKKDVEDSNTPEITYGYSKQHRPDLKQVVLNLAVTNKSDLPIFMASHSGNASDKDILIEATQQIENCCKMLSESPEFIYVGDSAMYESCLKESENIHWISRVPFVRKEAKKFVKEKHGECKQLDERSKNEGYKIYSSKIEISGKSQRWLLVYSPQALNRAQQTLDRNKTKEKKSIEKELWHLGNQEYNCAKDAQKILAKKIKKWKYHEVSETNILPVKKYEKPGAPKKGAKKEIVGYKIQVKIKENQKKIEETLIEKSHFIIATNEMREEKLSDEEMLIEYKDQQKVEKSFAFIKDKTFEVSSVFLKKQSRIDALMAIMVLSLFVYSLTQYYIRETLKEKKETVPNQQKKEIQNPTAKWIFYLFRNIQILQIKEGKKLISEEILNLNPLLERIITYFGNETIAIYR